MAEYGLSGEEAGSLPFPSGWYRASATAGDTHIVPLNDLKEHLPANCWCRPTEAEPGLWSHNSMDRREEYENGRPPS